MIAAVPDLPSIWPFMVMRITKGYDPSHIWAIGGYLLVTFAGALIGEAVLSTDVQASGASAFKAEGELRTRQARLFCCYAR